MVSIDQFRRYLRNPPDDDQELQLYLDAARESAKAAGIPDYRHNAKYDLFLCALAANYYDNRAFGFSGAYQATAETNARRLINAFVLELRHASDGEEAAP